MFTLMFGLTAYVMSGAVALAGTAAAVGTTAVIAGASKVAKNAHDKELLEKVMPIILESLSTYTNPVKAEDFVKDFQEKIFDAYGEYDIYRTIRLMVKAKIMSVLKYHVKDVRIGHD